MNIYSIKKKFNNLKLRNKLLISYIILISIPALTTAIIYYNRSSNIIFENSKRSIFEIVKKNSEIMDLKFSKVQQSAQMMAIDKEIFEIINRGKPDSEDKLVQEDIELSQLIRRYFPEGQEEYSVYLATDYYIFGNNSRMFIPQKEFINTKLYKDAQEADGKLVWVPTYDFASMYNLKEIKKARFEYRKIFSAVKVLKCSRVFAGDNLGGFVKIIGLNSNVKKPILLINFKEDVYRENFENSIPVKNAKYFILDNYGNIVCQSENGEVEKKQVISQLKKEKEKKGIISFSSNKKKFLLCYDTSQVTGWISVVVVPNDGILNSLPLILRYTLWGSFILTVMSIIIALLISKRITYPIMKLMEGVKKAGEGNFDNNININTEDEIGTLVSNFNDMNKKISVLIEENYEAQIRALNLQLNPHFMANTLNTINWMAIDAGQNEISKMILSLSSMLRYTLRDNKELVVFENDFEWLKNYIYIMSNRYENIFTVEYQVDSILKDTLVPKLFMQPFVENTIIHGFKNIEQGGKIIVGGCVKNDTRYFSITDNGCGISSERIDEIMQESGESIGISNINKRIKLLYGDAFGVSINSKVNEGTNIVITMPYSDLKNRLKNVH